MGGMNRQDAKNAKSEDMSAGAIIAPALFVRLGERAGACNMAGG